MNSNLSRLFSMAEKQQRTIVGLMSGTSLDGLDIVLCAIEGHGMNTTINLKEFITIPYPTEVKEKIRKVFAKEKVDFGYLILLNGWLGKLHGRWIKNCLDNWNIKPSEVDIIASHGQTVFHNPRILHGIDEFENATFQIGDGDHIAVETGIITISDFRQKHVAAGGEGAPLALCGDYFLFSKKGENRVLLNMGGIANFTFLPGSLDSTEVVVTDTGPGNTLLDAYTQELFKKDFDEDAILASMGKVNEALLSTLEDNSFFAAAFPKTTGPELFNKSYVADAQRRSSATEISPHDLLATLTRFSSDTITDALKKILKPQANYKIYTSGGGAHNPLLIKWIKQQLPGIDIGTTNELGIPGDAKEAILFAVLANETIMGQSIDFKRKGMPAVTMGKISFPM
jgi:anhydro-N-acetylmuramic acid kinase